MCHSYAEYSPSGLIEIKPKEVLISKRTLIIATTITTLAAVGAIGTQTANAAAVSSSDPTSNIVQKLTDKFTLNRDDVQSVFDAQRTEMEARREQETKDKLAQAVKDGELRTWPTV